MIMRNMEELSEQARRLRGFVNLPGRTEAIRRFGELGLEAREK
jgi:hypothetical protein